MFGLGPSELILVFIIALIVFGPGRLPELGKALGKTMREFREASTVITQDLTREMRAAERAARGEKDPPMREKVHRSGDDPPESTQSEV